MTKVAGEVLIDATAEKVWEILADFGGIYKWAPGIVSSYSTSENNGGAGASRHCDIAGFGGIEEYVTEWTDGKSIKYKATSVGPIAESFAHWFVTPQGDKALVHAEFEYDMRFGLLGALMNKLLIRRKMKQGMHQALGGLWG